MHTALLILAVVLFGVETEVQPDGAGGRVFVIEIEPELLDALGDGAVLSSELPPDAVGVTAYRIVVRQDEAATPPPDGEPGEESSVEKPSGEPDDGLIAVNWPNVAEQTVLRPETTAEATDEAPDEAPELLTNVLEPPPLAALDPVPEEGTAVEAAPASGESDILAATAATAGPGQANREDAASSGDETILDLDVTPASGEKETAGENDASSSQEASGPAAQDDEEGSWLPLIALAVGLCVSVGVNCYLFLVTWDSRRHYRDLVRHTAALN